MKVNDWIITQTLINVYISYNARETKFIAKIYKSNDVSPTGNEHVYQWLINNPIINLYVI